MVSLSPCPQSRLNEKLSYALNECFQDCVSDLYKILCKCVYLGHRVFVRRWKGELKINEYTALTIQKDKYLIH